jgi:hypothetical protein
MEQKLDYNGYFLVSASSGFSVPDSVFLSAFKVFDPTKVVTNHHFQDSHERKAEYEHYARNIARKVNDLIHDNSGNLQMDGSMPDVELLRSSINKQDYSVQTNLDVTDSMLTQLYTLVASVSSLL